MCKVQVNRGCILNVCALLHKLQLLLPPPPPPPILSYIKAGTQISAYLAKWPSSLCASLYDFLEVLGG